VLVTDNVFGRIRVSPYAYSVRITHDVPSVVVFRRDRNIIAIESEVRRRLGNGVDSFLAVAGDTLPHLEHLIGTLEIINHLRALQESLPDFEVGSPTSFSAGAVGTILMGLRFDAIIDEAALAWRDLSRVEAR
jgi:5,10-methylenetetrahydrofolate reductase